jgi:alpha-tubulin suppressor-like RCC1 family protein
MFALLSCTGADTVGPENDTVAGVNASIPRPMIRVGESIQANAIVVNAKGEALAGRSVTWKSTNDAIATVSTAGLISSHAPGDVSVQATVEGKIGEVALKVTVVPVSTVTVSAPVSSVAIGNILVLSAIAKDSSGKTLSGRTITWSTSDQSRALVSADGVLAGLTPGTVDVTASSEGKSGQSRIEVVTPVSQAAVSTVAVSIPRTAFRVGESLQAAALPLDVSGGVLPGRTITWSSSNPDVATVSPSGMVAGLTEGSTTISAVADGKTGEVVVRISLVPVSTVVVVPGVESVSAGASLPLTAILKDSANRVLTGRAIEWSSSNAAVANVTQVGVVNGVLVGSTEIVATAEGKQGKAAITVNTLATPVETITLTPLNADMSGGAAKQITAVLRDVNGNVLGGRTISWISSNPDRASVSATGVVTASPVDAPVVITATVEGKTATSSIGIHTFTRMSAGRGFSCGLTSDGTAYCWGGNSRGQLGDGSVTPKLLPVKVATDIKFVAITSGSSHSCGLAETGLAYCWGENSTAQLGDGTTTASPSPVPVGGGYRFLSIAASAENTCATTPEREVYCWGKVQYYYDDIYGGNARWINQTSPLRSGSGMVAVVAGLYDQYCSVDEAGLAYCWTVQFLSPLYSGQGPSSPVLPPVRGPISTTYHFTTVRVGYRHACGIVETGQAYCWGENASGQLGDGTTVNKGSPTLVLGGFLFESLAAGGDFLPGGGGSTTGFTCGVAIGGKAYCWGVNSQGELGTGSTAASVLTPQPVAGNALFTGIRASFGSTCGLAVGGAAYCWGGNSSGQFGNGTTVSSTRPTYVFGN